jgi:alkylhydroperoxidase family enzyme
VASTLEHVAWESCLIEPAPDRELEAYARRRQGIANPALRYFGPVPWLARALVDLHPEYGLLIHLEQRVADLVSLVVSQENSCRFCYAAVRAMLWSQGMSLARIQGIEHDLTRADLSPRTVAAIAFGRSQSRSGPAGARAARAAIQSAGIGADELKEIAYVVGTTDFANRVHTIPAIPTRPIERMPERLHMRLLRPLVGRLLKSRHSRGRATPLDRVPPHPYVRLVTAYAGSPIAPVLARTLEQMWASPHLTRRCKLLMLAVVARGLACEVCAPEIGEALQQEGLTAATIGQVLRHLDAPELDTVERLLVPFARETIWYEPALLQRRARGLRERLTGPQFLEAIGVAALANGLCRMGPMVLDPP